MTKRISRALIFIAIFTIVILLSACTDAAAENDDAVTESQDETDDGEYLYIVKDGVTDFWVIRSDYTEGAEVQAAVSIRKAIGEAAGVEPGITTDWEKNPVYEHEIIIGETLREETGYKVDRIALGETGYIIKEVDGKIYISGGMDPGTTLAAEYFIDTFVKPGGDIKIPVGYEYIVYHQYDIPELYIDMNLVDESYKIVTPDSGGKTMLDAAEKLQAALYDKTGLMLEIVKGDTSAEKAFIITFEKPEIDGVHEMYVNGSSLILSSSSSQGPVACVDTFISMYLDGKTGKYNFPGDFHYLDLGDYIIINYPD